MEDKSNKMCPEDCMKAGKCLLKDMMDKMEDVATSKEEYDGMSEEEKDKADEKEVMSE